MLQVEPQNASKDSEKNKRQESHLRNEQTRPI